MKSRIALYALTIVMLVVLVSCGGNNSRSVNNDTEEKEEPAKSLSPLEIGENIAGLYVQAFADLAELVKDQPPAEEVQPAVEALKEEYVQQLVVLGKQREALEPSDRSTVDLNIRVGINEVYDQPSYTIYGEAVNHYFNDKAVHDLLLDFNIITQYASFDLLKEQEPEEAQRLGIE